MTRQKFAVFGFVDSNAVGRGRALDAAALNAMARNHNTTLQNREPVFALAFDAKTDGSFVDASYPGAMQLSDETGGTWAPIGWPIPFAKRPHVREILISVRAMTTGQLAWIGAGSIADPFIGRSDQYTLVSGGTTPAQHTLSVPVTPGPREMITLHWRSEQTGTASSGKGRASDNIGPGSEFFINEYELFWTQSGGPHGDAWAVTPASPSSSTYAGSRLALLDGSGSALVAPRIVTSVAGHAGNYLHLTFSPPISSEEAKLLNEGGSWALFDSGSIRIYSVAAYESLIYGA